MNPLRAAIRIWFLLSPLISDLHADPRPERTIPDGSDTRDRFLKLIARPRVPFAPNERTPSSSDGLTKIGFDFETEANQRVPGLMIRSINLILPCPNSMGFCSQRNILDQKKNDQQVRFPFPNQNRWNQPCRFPRRNMRRIDQFLLVIAAKSLASLIPERGWDTVSSLPNTLRHLAPLTNDYSI